jgi:hypothetical protein
MLGSVRVRTLGAVALVLAALSVAAVALGAVDPDDRDARGAASGAGCGAQSATTLAAVEQTVARRIYAEETRGAETRRDSARVRSFAPLLEALQGGEPAAVQAAVHELVYKPHWHIVRLRVVREGRVLADVGGPDVTAPVSGTLRTHGRTLGRYLMSVQDDLGYVKLVTRFTAAPIDLYRDGSLVMGTLAQVSRPTAAGSVVHAGGRAYTVDELALKAFPAGSLEAALFVPAATSAQSCAALRLSAWGSVALHVAARLQPLSAHYQDLADVLRTVTGGRVLVRAGSRHVVGGGPRRLPASGSLRYGGDRWAVYSWSPVAGQRVYFLTPPG